VSYQIEKAKVFMALRSTQRTMNSRSYVTIICANAERGDILLCNQQAQPSTKAECKTEFCMNGGVLNIQPIALHAINDLGDQHRSVLL
jgi:hypothetical protein